MKRSRLLLVVIGAFVVFGVAQSGLGLASSAGTATIAADKADYSPGSTVTLTGTSWAANEAVHITVDDSAGQAWSYAGDVTADAAGAFTTQVTLPSLFIANYTVTATGPTSGTATTTFTDNVAANLDQCQNIDLTHLADPCGTTGTGHPTWDNGNINGSNSQYREGDGLPYRSSITGLTNGTWTIRLQYDFTKAGIFAIDRLTKWNLTQAANPCLAQIDVTCSGAPTFTFTMPGDAAGAGTATIPTLPSPLHSFNGLAPVTLPSISNWDQMAVWVTTASSLGSCVVNHTVAAGQNAPSYNDNLVLQSGSSSGDSTREFAFKITVSGCGNNNAADLMFGWSGHVASHLDWGAGKGAASISGSPFHMRVLGVDQADGTKGGNQDRSVQLGAIVQTLTVKKVLSPVGSGTFDLQIDGTTKAAAVGNGGTTGAQAVSAGNHSVGELGAGGTSLANFSASISCVDDNGTVVASGSASSLAGVPVAPGANVVCTITNTQVLAHLTLVKHVTNDNGGTAQPGDWTLSASGPTPLSGTTPVGSDVTAGTYNLSESGGPSGYTASSYSCVKNGGSAVSGNSITLAPGDNATCTITNDDNAPSLTLDKIVVNDNGGTAAESAWTLTANGGTAGTLSGPGATGHTDVQSGTGFKAGTYSLSESAGPSGYTASSWSCVKNGGAPVSGSSIALGLGDSAVCTITNNDNAPSLTLDKIVVNDNGGSAAESAWTLTADGGTAGTLSGPGASGHTDVISGTGFKVGTYSLSESAGPSGYTASSWSCVKNGDAPVTGASISLGLGDSAVCTITNDDNAPSLTLDKIVVNDNGGSAAESAWTLTANGGGAGTLSGPGASGHTDVVSGATFKAGTYSLSESAGPGGYTASSWSCVKNGGAPATGSSITLAPGDTATCTITNDDNAPSLTLDKIVVNDNGGTAAESAWTLTANGGTAGTLSGPGAAGHTDVVSGGTFKAGTYSLSESTGPAGYSASSWSCVKNGGAPVSGASITLALGDTATCTITNDDQAPSLTLNKIVVNDNGGTAAESDWTLTADGGTAGTLTGPGAAGSTDVVSGAGFKAGTYSLSESAGPSGYSASSWSCVKNGGAPVTGASIALGLGDSAACTITNDDQAPSLTLDKIVVNDNGGTAAESAWTLTADGGGAGTLSGPGASGHTDVVSGATFKAGTYSLSESAGPAGYSASDWSCVKNGGAPVSGASIALGLGDSAVCTITNDDQAPSLTLDKIVVNDNGGTAAESAWTLTANGGGAGTLSGPGAAGHTDVVSGGTFKAGTYSLSESAGPGGYTASSWSCVKNGGAPVTGSSIALGLGDTATCTITNDDNPPSLTLNKVVVNDNGGTAAESAWTLTADGGTAGMLSGPGASGNADVVSGAGFKAGTYSLSESVGPDGYTASSWSCVKNGGAPATGSSISLGLGDSAVCTITNDDNAPSLTLDKIVVNDNGGTAAESAWTLTANGGTAGTLSGPGAAGHTDVVSGATFKAGTYALSESTGPSGYSASDWSCVKNGGAPVTGASIALGLGDSAVCTITNDDKAPKLTLDKIVVNDNGGTAAESAWTLTANGGGAGTLSGPGAAGHTDVVSDGTFQAGTYALSESAGPSGYTASSWSCVKNGGAPVSGASIALAPGDTATCTITNDDQAPSLTLDKIVVNDNGGTAAESAWTLTANGGTAGTLSGPGATGHTDVQSGTGFKAGTYSLSESTGPAGYTASSWSCVKNGGAPVSGSSIALGLGDTATCTITNDDNAPSLTLDKIVVNDNGGTAAESAWTLTANGGTAGTLSGPGAAGHVDVVSGATFKAGTYSLSESGGVAGYAASSWSCVKNGGSPVSGSSISLGLGDTATCTITNDDTPGKIVIVKSAKPASGTFSFTTTGSTSGTGTSWPAGFTLTGSTTGGGNTRTFTVDPGTYTVTESPTGGWVLTGIGGSSDSLYGCVVSGSNGSTGVGDLNTLTATITIHLGDTVTCTFENTGATTRTQGFWATHPQLAKAAWFGGTAGGHTFDGVASVLGDTTLCGRPIDTLGKLMGGFWSGISKTSTGGKRSALDQARMQLLQQLLAAELNNAAFGASPGAGVIAGWEAAYCGTNQKAIKDAASAAASFNQAGDSGAFTPGMSADTKTAKSVADLGFWDALP